MVHSSPPVKRRRPSDIAGLAVPAGLLIGLGVGMLIDEIAAGLLIGLGAGFAVMLVVWLVARGQ